MDAKRETYPGPFRFDDVLTAALWRVFFLLCTLGVLLGGLIWISATPLGWKLVLTGVIVFIILYPFRQLIFAVGQLQKKLEQLQGSAENETVS